MVEETEDLHGTLELLGRYKLLPYSRLVTKSMYGSCIYVSKKN